MKHRRRQSPNANADTPLAKEYRRAKKAYHRAGKALRKSCSSRARKCGFESYGKRRRFKLVSSSVKAMRDEFLRTRADGGTNESIIEAQLGHLNVKDPAQWEAIKEKYGTKDKPVETFDQAFALLAKEAGKDWTKFDIQLLRDLPGLGGVELPLHAQEAKGQEEEQRFYEESVPF